MILDANRTSYYDNNRLDFIQYLIERGADPTVRDNTKQSAQDIAVFYQQKEVAAHFHGDSPFTRHGGYGEYHEERQARAAEEKKDSHK